MTWWMWLALGIVLVLLELLTPGGFYFIFFGISAVLIGVLARWDLVGPVWVQWLLFSGLSIAGLLLFRRPLLARLQPPPGVNQDIDSLIGETAIALTDIYSDTVGKAEMRGTAWSARNAGDGMVVKGQRCRVERVEGLMLWIRG